MKKDGISIRPMELNNSLIFRHSWHEKGTI